MNSALEPLLLAILRDGDGGWGQAPTPLRGERRPLGSSPEQGCGGGRHENRKRWLLALQAPESAKGNLIAAFQSGFFKPGRRWWRVIAFIRLGHLFLGGRRCLAFAAMEKGRGELGRRYRCHHCRRLPPGGTLSLRRRRHLVTPAPANAKCPQSPGAASSRRRALWERDLGR